MRKSAHAVYDIQWHIVLTVKYRRPVLAGEIKRFVNWRIIDIARVYGWGLASFAIMPDHIHLLVSAKPAVPAQRIAWVFKSLLARAIFAKYPALKSRRGSLRGGVFFTRGTYYGAVGHATTEAVAAYIQEQG